MVQKHQNRKENKQGYEAAVSYKEGLLNTLKEQFAFLIENGFRVNCRLGREKNSSVVNGTFAFWKTHPQGSSMNFHINFNAAESENRVNRIIKEGIRYESISQEEADSIKYCYLILNEMRDIYGLTFFYFVDQNEDVTARYTSSGN